MGFIVDPLFTLVDNNDINLPAIINGTADINTTGTYNLSYYVLNISLILSLGKNHI